MGTGMDADTFVGVFSLGDLLLGLPLGALREAIPLGPLATLPCDNLAVVGAIGLRGTMLPVLDLRRILGLPPADYVHESVVVMAHQGYLLGLLADQPQGLFDATKVRIDEIGTISLDRPIFSGGFERPDQGGMVALLSPAAIASLPGVPLVLDVPDERAARVVPGAGVAERTQVVLMRSGSIPLCIESAAVYSTVVDPTMVESSMAAGHFVGFVSFGGRDVPAVDLAMLSGFGDVRGQAGCQAVLVRYPDGFVAFIVGAIVDVLDVDLAQAIALPRQTLSRAELFRGTLPADALPAHVREGAAGAFQYTLVLDGGALRADPEMVAFARLDLPSQDVAARDRTSGDSREAVAESCTVVTYSIGHEVATPVAQIVEILPWREELGLPNRQDRAVGLIVDRGRAIPVFSLAEVIGLDRSDDRVPASVLVVESGAGLVGFQVTELMNIDQAPRDKIAEVEAGQGQRLGISRSRAMVFPSVTIGSNETARLLSVIDLVGVARGLYAPDPRQGCQAGADVVETGTTFPPSSSTSPADLSAALEVGMDRFALAG